MKATVTLQTITPETATEWLADRWGEQRNIRKAHVARLASDMTAKQFHVGPDAILRIKGKIANGQHRLEAVALSGKPQTFIILESSDEELYKVIDAGLRRTVADGLLGMGWARNIPSIARWVRAYEGGSVRASARNAGEAGRDAGSEKTPSQIDMINYIMDNKEALTTAAEVVSPLYHQTQLLPFSIGGALLVIAGTHSKATFEKAKGFLQGVYVDGGPNSAGDLRNRLIMNRGARAKLHSGYIFGITVKAFKSYCNGTRPGVLKWAKDEPYPQI